MLKNCEYCKKEFNARRQVRRFCCHSCSSKSKWIESPSIFNKLFTEIEAYTLGFICADGCVSYDNHSHRYRLTISSNDEELMQEFHKFISPEKKMYKNKTNNYTLISNNEYDINYMKNLGITERKSLNLLLPVIPIEMMSHFIRGIFDGDGCVYKSISKQRVGFEYTYTYVSFTSGSKEFLLDLQSILTVYNIESNINQDCRKTTYYLKIYKKDSINKFYNLIYNNSPSLFLKRKKDKFQ
jgi:intein/homing endonuclease